MSAVTTQPTPVQSPLEFVTPNDWILITSASRRVKFAKNEEIIRQDSQGGTMFVLRRGTARIELVAGKQTSVVARLGPGQICGEMAFLENRRSSASVVADEEVEADAIEWAELRRIFQMFPHLGARFFQSLAVTLSRRLRATSAKLAQSTQG